MIAQDVINLVQDLSGEGIVGQRFAPSQYIRFLDRAQKCIVRDLKWPPSRYVFTTTPTVQEYQLQEIILILDVYLNGQLLTRTDIPTLEGRQIQLYDQTGQGGGPGGLVVQNEAPNLAGSTNTPQWTSQPPLAYPVTSPIGGVAPDAQPWFAGRRPAYYCRGGNIGFLPAPLGAITAVCDVVSQPVTLQTANDALMLPDTAADALAWQVIEYMFFSDKDTSGAADQRNYAMTEKQKALAELRAWKRGYDGGGPRGPKMLTYRSFFVRGRNTMGDD
jgi:hypothetical protein